MFATCRNAIDKCAAGTCLHQLAYRIYGFTEVPYPAIDHY